MLDSFDCACTHEAQKEFSEKPHIRAYELECCQRHSVQVRVTISQNYYDP